MSTTPSTPTPDDKDLQIQKDLDALNISKPEDLNESQEDSNRVKKLKAELRAAREKIKSTSRFSARDFNKLSSDYLRGIGIEILQDKGEAGLIDFFDKFYRKLPYATLTSDALQAIMHSYFLTYANQRDIALRHIVAHLFFAPTNGALKIQYHKFLKAEEPKAEEPKAEEPKAEEPKAEEPKAEEPKAEEPKAEEPKANPYNNNGEPIITDGIPNGNTGANNPYVKNGSHSYNRSNINNPYVNNQNLNYNIPSSSPFNAPDGKLGIPPNSPYINNGTQQANNGNGNLPPTSPTSDIFGEDKYHEKLEDGKTSESEIAKDRKTRLERTRHTLEARLKSPGINLNTPDGLRNATEQAFDVVMQASNQVMLDRQAYRIGKQGKLRRGFNSFREGLASKYPKATFFLSAAARTGAILGAAALAPQLGALTAFGFTTAALRRPSAAMIAKFRRSKPSHTSAYSNLAIMQQMEIRKTTTAQVPSTTVTPNTPIGTLDNKLYEGYQEIAEKNQAKLKENVKNKLRASTLFTSPTSTPAQRTAEIIRVMMEEQEAMFKQMETERDKLTRNRIAEWLGAAAMAGLLAFGMSAIKGAVGGGDTTPPAKTDPTPTPPDPVPTPPPVPPVVVETPTIGSFTGDFSTAERVFDPNRSLLDVSNPADMTNPLPGVELSNSMAVEVSTEAKGAAGRLLIHDPNNVENVVGRFNPGEHIKVDGSSVIADIKNPVTGEMTKMRMFPVVGEDGVRKGLVAGAYLKRL